MVAIGGIIKDLGAAAYLYRQRDAMFDEISQ